MTGVVADSILVELIAKFDKYEQDFKRAGDTAEREMARIRRATDAPVGISGGDDGSVAATTNRKRSAASEAKRIAKDLAVSEASAAKDAASAVAAAEKVKQDAIRETERVADESSKRRMANIDATLAAQASAASSGRSGPLKGTGNNDGPQRPLSSNAASFINGADTGAEADAQKELNALKLDEIKLQDAKTFASKADKAVIDEQLATLRLIRKLEAEGLDDAAINIKLDERDLAIQERKAVIAAEQAASAKKQSLSGLTKFAEGAGVGRGGSAALVGGLVAGAAVGGIVAAAKDGLEYAADLANVSKQLGLTTKDLQVYQSGAERVGVTNEQLRTSFGQLASNIGKAQEGAKEQGKIFGKDGLAIDLGNAKDGYKSLGDLLPTIVERFSSIKDPARRAALETALFGESGRKLDSLLSGGTDSIKALGDELERTGGILSGEDIARSAKVAADLKLVGDQLERELASTVSQNASAIESLATSLLNGAGALLKFIDAFQRFRAQNQIGTGDPGLAATGRATLLQSAQGRDQALNNNRAGLAAIRNASSSDAVVNTGNGVGAPGLLGGNYTANNPQALAAARKQLLSQRREILQAYKTANAQNAGSDATAQGGKVGNLNVFAPDPKKPKKGKSAESIEAERLERQKKFTAAEAQEEAERLQLLSELTSDTRLQDQYARERVRTEQTAKDKEITDQAEATINRQKLKGGDAELERSRAQILIKENDANADLQIQSINRKEQSRYLEEQLAHLKTAADIRTDDLDVQEALAKTTKQRAEIEKKLLAISIQNQRDALNKTIADKATTPEALKDAQTQLAALPAKQAGQQAVLDKKNQGALKDYFDTLNDPNARVQAAVVDKLKSVDEAITDAAANTLGVKDPFLKSLLQIFLQQNVLKPLYDAFQNKGASGGIGGIFGSIAGLFGGGSSFNVGGTSVANSSFDLGSLSGSFASGGNVSAGKIYKINENGPELFQPGMSGQIIPTGRAAAASGGNMTVVQNISVDGRNSVTPAGFAGQILAQANAHANKAAAQAGKTAYNTSPIRQQKLTQLGS